MNPRMSREGRLLRAQNPSLQSQSLLRMVKALNTRDPTVRRFIIDEYHKKGEKYIQEEFGVSRQDIKNWKDLLASTGSLTPRFEARGRTVELSDREIKKLENKLISDPFATNAE